MGEIYPNPFIYLPEEVSSSNCELMPADAGLTVCESVGTYVPRNPEKTVLYGVVAAHLETFLARQRERDRVVRASSNRNCGHFWIAAFWSEVF